MSFLPPFLLSKWYLDCHTDSGELFIFYASELTIAGLHIAQSSWIKGTANGEISTDQTYFTGQIPREEGNGILWSCPALDIQGSWQSLLPPAPPITLFKKKEKDVIWQCLQPLAKVQFTQGNQSYSGIGYAERLDMSLAPWKLPISRLHWGRFHSDKGNSITWIIWEGPHPLVIILEGNNRISPARYSASPEGEKITWNDKTLTLHKNNIIRSGKIGESALKDMPPLLKKAIPPSILDLEENKWYGFGEYTSGSNSEAGFAVHEVILFP